LLSKSNIISSPLSGTGIGEINLDVLENVLSFYIRVVDHSLSRDLDERLRTLEVARGKGKITALLIIDSHPGVRPSVVAKLAMKDRSAMGRILDNFQAHGLITRKVSKNDSRAQELYITETGAEMASKVRGIVVEQSENFFDVIIPRHEQEQLMDILKRAYLRLREAEE
jgi:DNA-binding MarR family transcriptional regulator